MKEFSDLRFVFRVIMRILRCYRKGKVGRVGDVFIQVLYRLEVFLGCYRVGICIDKGLYSWVLDRGFCKVERLRNWEFYSMVVV